MRISSLILLLLSSSLHAGDALKEARTAWLRGNYGEAAELYAELGKKPATRSSAVIGLSRAYQSEGKYDEAQKAIEAALTDLPKDAALLARHAELLFLRGRWDDADQAAQKAIAIDEESFLARWIQGQILQARGKWDEADEAFRWFVRTYTQRYNDDKEITDPDELMLVGLAGLERARLLHLTDQFEFVLTEVFAYLAEHDKEFWPAEYQAGRLYLEKYNKAASQRAFDRALSLNPRAAEALAGQGIAAMQRLEIKEAEHFAEQALKINPSLTEALRLKADVLLFSNEYAAAVLELEKARHVNPREEATLGRLAVAHYMNRNDKAFQAILAEVEKNNPKAVLFYTELADGLEQHRYFTDAEKYYNRALDLEPRLPWALNGLGSLQMRLGEEDEARKTLDRAIEADEFNIRVSNTLKVLKHLEGYDTIKTEHFIIRYEAKNDAVLARVMAKYLEEIHQEFDRIFNYHPKEPILIEVFNRHDMFSGRVVQLPDLHTIGACTGKMFAMVSPRDTSGVIGKPFNWVRVVRHELVHVFNLEQTNFRIPHWYTEGLAVKLEGSAAPREWTNLLAEKMQDGDLLNLDNILLAFVRPRSPEQWNQAYMQSLLYVQYLAKSQGEKAIGKLLAAYAEGLETDAALVKAIGVSKADFENGYLAFLKERLPKEVVRAGPVFSSLRAIKEAQAKDPNNPDLTALLAERYMNLANPTEARTLADKALGLKKFHPLAVYVKAMALTQEGNPDTAYDLLKTAIDETCSDVKPLRLLAKLHAEHEQLAEAAKLYERCRQLQPYDASWLAVLGKTYLQTGENDKLLAVMKEIVDANPDDLETRKKIAQIAKKAGNHADVEKYARQALEIDVRDATAQQLYLDALTAQNKVEEEKTWRKLLAP